jgi:hypothetical protein
MYGIHIPNELLLIKMGATVSSRRASQRAAEETVLIEVPEPEPKTFEEKGVNAAVQTTDAEVQNTTDMVDQSAQQEFPEIILMDFDESIDFDESVSILFDSLDTSGAGLVSKADVIQALQQMRHESPHVDTVIDLISHFDAPSFSLSDLQSTLREIPYPQGLRVHWTRALRLEAALARHLPAGRVLDGLQGVRAMTEQQLVLLCEQFARELPLIILPAWRALSSRAESDSDSESKCQPRRPATVRLGVRCPAAAWQCPSHC